ncbi:MAG: hypothetical protein GKS00_29475 [Alphaproteobacteria bacterium]|nr:hypothetical protein [Alphaproteobacteria bacterium]
MPSAILILWMSARVFRKAGRSGWWSLLLFVPVLNIAVVWWFAFAKWPAVEEAQGKQIHEVFS